MSEVTDAGTNTYVYDVANRLTSVNGTAYTWDANGNLLSDGTNTYTYDHANRLVGLTQGSDVYSYAYNGQGDRYQQTLNGVTTTYQLDLAGGLTQVLAGGDTTYLYGVNRIAQVSPTQTGYFLPDVLGSVRQIADGNAPVNIVLAQSYTPYGEVLESYGMGASEYAFTGEMYDPQTGLVNLRARYYAPSDGRFMSRDTWKGDYSNPHSLNKWAYVEGNPINRIDPRGNYAEPALGILNDDDPPLPCTLADDYQFCILTNGAFIDESHYGSNKDDPHSSQSGFWADLQAKRGAGIETIGLEQDSMTFKYIAYYTVDIPSTISDPYLKKIGAGIFLDFQIRFETWQYSKFLFFANHSSFEAADIPSTYLGYVAAVNDFSYETIIEKLGGGCASHRRPAGHPQGWHRPISIWECLYQGCDPNKLRNDTLNLKAGTPSTGYTSLTYPNDLNIVPADDWETYATFSKADDTPYIEGIKSLSKAVRKKSLIKSETLLDEGINYEKNFLQRLYNHMRFCACHR